MDEPPPIRKIFTTAIEIDSEEERAKYLDDACGGDESLKSEIEGLIEDHLQLGPLTQDVSEEGLGATVSVSGKENASGATVGPYKLLQQIGEGGMGSVWMAEQEKPVRRMVALKIIKAGMDSKQVIARFEAERQALALMNHPNIAKVLDAGTTEKGRPYFVMELVKGVPITEFCDKNKYPPEQRLKLFIDVCRAVQHAHQKGVIHRDIKPSNVMVTLYDGVPVVKVIDFGLAKATSQKLTERTLFTAYGQMVGTPAYMSPEQAEMSGLDVDTRTDVYSLGVLLYELMTGTTPIDAKSLRKAGFAEIQRMIQQEEAPPMSTRLSSLGGSSTVIAGQRGSDVKRLSQLFRGDLDVIVAKSLDKDRSRRYTTPSDFADDVQRFLKNEAIEARPASAVYRLRKLYQRNKVPVATACMVASVLVLATILSTSWAIRATDAEQLAEQRLDDVEREQAKTNQALEEQERLRIKAEDSAEREQELAIREKELRTEAEAAAKREQENARLQAELRKQAERSEAEAKWNTYVAKLFPMQQAWNDRDFGRLYQLLEETAPGTGDPDFRGWEWYFLQDQANSAFTQITWETPLHGPVAWGPNKELFASRAHRKIVVWDAYTYLPKRVIDVDADFSQLAWSPSGKKIAIGTNNSHVKIFDFDLSKFVTNQKVPPRKGTSGRIVSLSWKSDSTKLVAANQAGSALIITPNSNTPVGLQVPDNFQRCGGVSWRPETSQIAASFHRGKRSLFNEHGVLLENSDPVSSAEGSLDWNPSGSLLASVEGYRIQLLDPELNHVGYVDGHNGRVYGVHWINNTEFVSSGQDQTIRTWHAGDLSQSNLLRIHSESVTSISPEPNGSRLISASASGIRVSDLRASLNPSISLPLGADEIEVKTAEENPINVRKEISFLQWSEDGRRVVCCGTAPILGGWWGIGGCINSHSLKAVHELGKTSMLTGVQSSSFEGACEIADWHGGVYKFDVLTGYVRAKVRRIRQNLKQARWTADQQYVSFFDETDRKLVVVNAVSRTQYSERSSSWIHESSWSPTDNRLVAVTGSSISLLTPELDKVASGRLATAGNSVTWDPTGSLVACGLHEGVVQILESEELRTLATLSGHSSRVTGIAWHPGVSRIATCSHDGTVRIWDTDSSQQLLELHVPGDRVRFESVLWSPDGYRLLAGTDDGRVCIWGSDKIRYSGKTHASVMQGVCTQYLKDVEKELPISHARKTAESRRKFVDVNKSLLERLQSGDSFERVQRSWTNAEKKLGVESRSEGDRRSWIKSMIHLVEADVSAKSTDWLADRLMETLKAEVNDDPTSFEAWKDLAEAYLVVAHLDRESSRDRFWEGAAEALSKLLEFDPEDELAMSRLAFIASEKSVAPKIRERFVDALTSRIEATDSVTQRTSLLNQRASLLLKLNRRDEYQIDIDATLRVLPDDSAEINKRCWEIVCEPSSSNRFPELVRNCVRHLSRLVKTQPESGIYLNTLGVTRYRAGDYQQAIVDLTRSNKLMDGNDAFNLFFIAMSQWKLDQKEKARETLADAIAWSEENAPKDEELIGFRREAQRMMVDLNPLQIASKELDEQNWQAAINQYAQALETLEEPAFADAKSLESVVFLDVATESADIAVRNLQDWSAAADATSKLHRLRELRGEGPSMLDRHRLTMLLVAAEQYEQAGDHVGNLLDEIDVNEIDPQTMRMVAHSASALPNPGEEIANRALDLAEKAAKSDPEHEWTKLVLGLAQLRAGELNSAIENLQAATDNWENASPPRSMAFAGIALAEFEQGNREEAKDALEDAKKALPPLPEPDAGAVSHDYLCAMALLKQADGFAEK